MKKVKVRIEGTSPLLQHRFPMEENQENKSVRRKKEYPAEEECKKALYQDDKGKIYQPAEHILGALVMAAKNFSYEKKRTYKEIVKSSVFVNPAVIYHEHQKWQIDRRPVVVMKARIVRARPRFDKWALAFEIEFDNEVMGKDKLKEMLDYAGQRVGIGDYRPAFGRFIVTKFE